ncbi:MAG: TonB-dependent receptor [Ignavibacteriae bacterium]|nr:TonB-dependent receptor [Ignavibacteriota bacterium]NOG97336.1 TonB-dependent receptor [Ignavibacteriota bacterium]
MKRFNYLLLALVLLTGAISAQTYTVSGKVVDYSSGEVLIGANVFIKGTTIGAATDENGEYSISIASGEYVIRCSYVGFDAKEYSIEVTNNMEVNFELTEYEFTLSVTVLADRAKERETPVAFANIEKEEMEFELGSRDIPLVLNTTPSVYATPGGGGAGDSRINIRGFDQRNFAVTINGVPINDMENGWVYWSNWDGVGDATSSIQVQRGLSTTTLATGGVGGVMNIITDPSALESGVLYKSEIGSGTFLKQSLFAHSGLIDKKFAISVGGVRKTGEGVVHRAWTDAWAYYLGASYQINDKNRIEFYANGAPQRHGQRTYALNAATFSHELARDLDFPQEVLNNPIYAEQGLNYNSNWSGVSPSYFGQQYLGNTRGLRYSPSFLNERENFYHKPIFNLNWYTQLSKQFNVYTTLYYSGGQGGGTGTFGSIRYNYGLKQRVVDWDATIANNAGNVVFDDPFGAGDSSNYAISTDRRSDPMYSRGGILRNSRNNQWTIGAISKAFYKVDDNLKISFGVDWRTAEIEHYREVRDLLGNDYFHFDGNEFDSPLQRFKKLGDKIDYFNINTVNWLGGFGQAEYTNNQVTLYGTAGYTMVKYDFTDHFKKGPDGGMLFTETDWIGGYQFKGGLSFRANQEFSVYVNGGYISKVPIFDQVIDDSNGAKADDPKNEKYISGEVGFNWTGLSNSLVVNGNIYYTSWTDRAVSVFTLNADGSDGLTFLEGVSQTHMGVELDARWIPVRFLSFEAAGSVGNWEYTDDVQGSYRPNKDTSIAYTYYLKNLKVGEAPQTQIAASVSFMPTRGMRAQLGWRWYGNYYSDFEPTDRTDGTDRAQVWKVPSYSVFDFHFSYNVPLNIKGVDVTVFAHVFNLLDELYVADATDNSAFNSHKYDHDNDPNTDDIIKYPHTASAAEIYPGLERSFNVGFSVGL